jgi:uncharacterized membrane protein YhaH (DUF805 family)
MMYWFIKCLKKYADFSGRARRKEFWMFFLFYFIFAIVLSIIDGLLGWGFADGTVGILYLLFALAIMLPYLAVTVRRLHDTGRSGWWYFIMLIPLVGPIWLIVLLATDGEPGENQYGPNPKEVGEEA